MKRNFSFSTSLKVLQIIDTLNIGGAEKVCLDLITLLLDAGHQVDCMVISSKGPLFEKVDKRANVFFLNRKNKYNPITMHKCASIACKYDIVHVHMRHTWAYVQLSSILFKTIKRLVFHDHYGDIAIDKTIPAGFKGFFKPRYYIGVSNDLVDWAETCLNLKKENVFLLANTILPNYTYSNTYSGDWIMISNLRKTKNILFAIELANQMKRQLVIFGNHDGSGYADSVLEAANLSGFARIVQNETNIQQYLANFSLALHTAYSETGPLVLMEYLAHGLPFITSNNGEVVYRVKDELPDYIANSFDTTEWVNKIETLENELKLNRIQIKIQLQHIFENKFSPNAYIEKCQKIYQSVLNS